MQIIEAAMAVFREKGYQNASMRDVADRAGIQSGSLYHHFTSKGALFAEAHGIELARAAGELNAAAYAFEDPWDRLEAACIRHLQIQVAPQSMTLALMADLSNVDSSLRTLLVAQRDGFEDLYRGLVNALPLKPSIDRSLYRTLLLTTLNTVPTWFSPGRRSIEDVAHQILLLFRAEQ